MNAVRFKMYLKITAFVIAAHVSLLTVAGSAHTPVLAQSQRNLRPDIDMFINQWQNSKPRMEYGSFMIWDILTKLEGGNPLRPTKKGAVLTDLNAVMYALLKPSGSTRPATLKSCQRVMYIFSGEGIIRTEKKNADLYEGIGVLMPPDVEFTITNTGNHPLTMYIIEEPVADDFRPVRDMIVRYEYDNAISTNVNRVDSGDWLFSLEDGLSTLVSFNPLMYEPKSLVPPHVHEPGVEEVWISLKGDMEIMIGRERRKFSPGSAYKVPANGITPHTNINRSDTSKKLLWMMKVPVIRSQPPQDEKELDGII